MATKAKRLKNPGVDVFPHMDPKYPVKPFIVPDTGARFVVVTDRQSDGLWKAFIAEDPRVHQLAANQHEAERQVIEKYHALRKNPRDRKKLEALEDAEDIAVVHARRHERTIPWETVKALYGLDSQAGRKRGSRSVGTPARSEKRSR